MEIMLDIAVKHPHAADVWVGMWPPTLSQALKRRFERNNATYINGLTNISEIALAYYRNLSKQCP